MRGQNPSLTCHLGGCWPDRRCIQQRPCGGKGEPGCKNKGQNDGAVTEWTVTSSTCDKFTLHNKHSGNLCPQRFFKCFVYYLNVIPDHLIQCDQYGRIATNFLWSSFLKGDMGMYSGPLKWSYFEWFAYCRVAQFLSSNIIMSLFFQRCGVV